MRKAGKWPVVRRLPEYIRRKETEPEPIPELFADRVLKLGILSFLIAGSGTFAGLRMKSPGFLLWSLLLGAFVMVQALCLLRIAVRKDYETVEGTVLEITGRYMPGRLMRVKISSLEGSETYLLLNKEIRLQTGKGYRFYFSKKQNVLSGIRSVDAAFNTGSFYGYEDWKG